MTEKKKKMAYVICVNDYPVEVSFLGVEGTQERVAEMQERLNVEDKVGGEKGIQRFVHYHSCPVVERRDILIAWISRYVIEEDFGEKHLDALVHIVGLMNDCEESEREILEFADKLYERYAR